MMSFGPNSNAGLRISFWIARFSDLEVSKRRLRHMRRVPHHTSGNTSGANLGNIFDHGSAAGR